jgi:hypothetical protein
VVEVEKVTELRAFTVPFGIILCALVLLHHYSRRCHITLNSGCIILYSYDREPSNIVKALKTILRASRGS